MGGIRLLCFIVIVGYVDGQCTFPNDFIGTWESSSDGTWTINSSHWLDLKVTGLAGINSLSFVCYEVQGNVYALQSTQQEEIFNGVFKSLYTCLDIRMSTAEKYVYYKNTDAGASSVTVQSTFSNICNKANYDQPYYHHVALKTGSETLALINCPDSLFGSFNYNACSDPSSTNTSMNVCDTRQQLIYNYTLCNTEQMFSADGVLDCVHYEESGSVTYLTVYNRDTAVPDKVSYFRFACLAVQDAGSTRQVTARPEECEANQSPTTISSPGQAIELTPYYLCQITTTVSTTTTTTTTTTMSTSTAIVITEAASSDTGTDIGLIIGIIIAVILLAIIVALIIWCCCMRKRRRKKRVDEERAIADDNDDQRSQRSDDRRGSGSSSQDEDKRSIDSGIGKEPPSGRGTGVDSYKRIDDQEQEEEVDKTVGEIDVDDKSSRPRSGQVDFRHLRTSFISLTLSILGKTVCKVNV